MTKRVFWMTLAALTAWIAYSFVHTGNGAWKAAHWLKAKRDAL